MKDINAWYADRCGVELTTITTYSGFIDCSVEGFICNGAEHPFTWSTQDLRCREIIRERFRIGTVWDGACYEGFVATAVYSKIYGEGKTIAESEIACLKAIYEAEKTA